MSTQVALMQLSLACQYILPQHTTETNLTIEGTSTLANKLAMLPLQLACQAIRQAVSSGFNMNSAMPTARRCQKSAMDLPQGYTVFPRLGAAYKLYQGVGKTWMDAKQDCFNQGASLAVINTFEKINHVMGLDRQAARYGIWVGIHKAFNNNWVEIRTRSALARLPWSDRREPHMRFRECAVINTRQRNLHSATCTNLCDYVCEIRI